MPQYDRVVAWYAGFTQNTRFGRLDPPTLPDGAVLNRFWANLIEDDTDEAPWETTTGTVIGTESSRDVRLEVDANGGGGSIPTGAGLQLPDGSLIRYTGRELTQTRRVVIISGAVTIRTSGA